MPLKTAKESVPPQARVYPQTIDEEVIRFEETPPLPRRLLMDVPTLLRCRIVMLNAVEE